MTTDSRGFVVAALGAFYFAARCAEGVEGNRAFAGPAVLAVLAVLASVVDADAAG